MKRKSGFMLYELAISFFILSIISIFMLSTIFTYKDRNVRARLISQIMLFKANVTNVIEKDLRMYKPEETWFMGSDNNYQIKLNDILTKDLKLTEVNNQLVRLTYYDYIKDLPQGAIFNSMKVDINSYSGNRYIVVITIPIYHEDLDEDGVNEGKYTIKIVYLYNGI